jgi:hypothetical protein
MQLFSTAPTMGKASYSAKPSLPVQSYRYSPVRNQRGSLHDIQVDLGEPYFAFFSAVQRPLGVILPKCDVRDGSAFPPIAEV